MGTLRQATRSLLRSPGFTGAALITLALGIGATTALFSVVYGVLLKPLPFPEPDRLVAIHHDARGVDVEWVNNGPGTYFTYREANEVFEDIGAWDTAEVSITGRGDPERVQALEVTAALLPLLRVQPALGRLFAEEDDSPSGPPRVLLTHGYWQRAFGGADEVIGDPLAIDGRPAEIIGVLPPSFTFLDTDPAVLLPLRPDLAFASIGMFDFETVARLEPGVTLAQANADIARMITLLPPAYEPFRLVPRVRALGHHLTRNVERTLWILFAMVGVVLLIASANVANLFLVRAERRHEALAIRSALGASRSHLAVDLFGESLLLALGGAVLGIVLARAVVAALAWIAPAELPRADAIAIDAPVVLFAVALGLAIAVVLGLLPLAGYGHPSAAALKEGHRSTGSPARRRIRDALVIAEVALAMVLLIVSGLMIRTFVAMRQVDPGFVQPEQVQTFRIAVPEATAGDPAAVTRLFERISERLEAVPGVESVGLSSSVTMGGDDNLNPVTVEGVPVPAGELAPLRRYKYIGPSYVETMGNRVIAGRTITWADVHAAAPVAIVSEAFARRYWPEPSAAVGKRITTTPQDPWREIVGVVGDEHDDGFDRPATTIVYWPMMLDRFFGRPLSVRRVMTYAVRSSRVGSPGFARELQEAVWSVEPSLPLAEIRTLERIAAESMAQTSFALVMLAIAAGVALALGVVGIYGVIAYVAAQRTREIGIRIALGSRAADVCRLFLRRGVLLACIGIAAGTVLAATLARAMSAMLFGVAPFDLVTYVCAAVGLGLVAAAASYLPARRAASIDPMSALRAE